MRARLKRQEVQVIRVASRLGEQEGREAYGPPSEILPGLFLGSAWNARHPETLRSLRISAVLSVAAEEASCEGASRIDVADRADDCDALLRAAHWLQEHRGERVLVHCAHGHSRSAAVVMLFLCRHAGACRSYPEALAMLREKRPRVAPNRFVEAMLLKLLPRK